MIADAVIVGAGIHGCSTALQLARAGIETVVFEHAHPGRHASGVNAGGVRRLGRHIAEIPLSLASMSLWQDIESLVDDDCGFQQTGQVKVAENTVEMETLRERVKGLQQCGFKHEKIITDKELRELAPAVSQHCCGAIYTKRDGHANPFKTVSAFYRAAQKAGARFYCNEKVKSITRTTDIWEIKSDSFVLQAPLLINAAGAWGNRIAKKLGENVPLEPTALMLMISEKVNPFCRPVVGAVGRTLSFKQFSNGTVLIGGGHKGWVDTKNRRAYLNIKELAINARTAQSIFPIMKNARIVRCWAGVEGFTPDNLPIISKSQTYPDTYHLFGFSAHGFQLGPITGKIMKDMILTGKSKLPIDSFRIDRFKHNSY